MTEQEKYDILHASPFAAELTDAQCRELSKIISVHSLKEGEVLIKEGHSDNSLYVVISGMLAVMKDSGAGEAITLHILKSGDLAGALGFIDGMEHSATLSSIGNTELFSLQRDAFEGLIATDPVIVYRVMRSIVRAVHGIVRRMNNQYVELTNYINKQHGRY